MDEPKTKGETLESTSEITIHKEKQDKIDVNKELLEKILSNEKAKKLIKEFDKAIQGFNLQKLLENENKLLQDYEQIKIEKDEYLSLLQRFKADFENYKKRAIKQEEQNMLLSSERIISKIFEPIEDMDRIIQTSLTNSNIPIKLDSLDLVYKKFIRILDDEGVVIINPKPGENFDPKIHEAISTEMNSKFKPGKIIQKFEQGYRIKDKIIRAAKVLISIENKENKLTEEKNAKNE